MHSKGWFSVGIALTTLMGCTSAPVDSTIPAASSAVVSSSQPPLQLPSPEPRSSRMADSLRIVDSLPTLAAVGQPWSVGRADNYTASVNNAADCVNVSEDEVERIAGVSRSFVTGQAGSEVAAEIYIGRYASAAGAAKVFKALRTCVNGAQPPAVTIGSAADRFTRCAQERPWCFSFRVIADTIVGTGAIGPSARPVLTSYAIRLTDLAAAGVPR